MAVSSLPPNWQLRRISELVTLNPKHDRHLPDDLVVSFVPMSGIDEVTGTIQAWKNRPLGEVRKGYTHFRNGDILFAKITPSMENGKCAVARGLTNGLGCGSTEFFVLRPNDQILAEYLHYFLRQESYRQAARASMTGAVGQARVPKQFLLDTMIPVPSIEEQRHIVRRLGEVMERSRRVREAVSRARDEASMHWSMVEDIVWRHGDRPLPTIPLASVLSSLSNGIATPPRAVKGQKILRISAVRPGRVDLNDVRYLPVDGRWERYLLKDGDLLFVRYNGNAELTGVCAMVRGTNGDLVYPDKLIRAEVKKHKMNPEYLELALNTGLAREYIRSRRKTAAGQVGISGRDLKQVPVPLTSLEEQDRVVKRCREILQTTRIVEETCTTIDGDLRHLEMSLLAQAFRGEI